MIKSNKEIIQKKVLYTKAVYGQEEKDAVLKSLENGWLASGPLVKKFEEEIAKLFGKKYGIAVNSGSSANLLVIKALGLKKGAEIITPACTFGTTVSEIVNNGSVPVFVDSVIGRYTINEDLIEEAITDKTAAILVPQLIGGVCDMVKLQKIANKHNLFLIDDSCDTLAPYIGLKTVASFAYVTTTSFYGSHIITACGMGGMIMTDDSALRDKIITLRDWGRVGNDLEDFEKRFDFKINNIPYDSKFLYSEFGYNLKMNEVAAAFGLEQLKRLPKFIKIKQRNFGRLTEYFKQYQQYFHLPELLDEVSTNWLAYPLTISTSSPFKRYDLLKHLEKAGIQTRVLFSGNITRHPVFKQNTSRWRVAGNLDNADHIMANGFLIGCHQGMTELDIGYIIKTFEKFLGKYK